MQIDKRWIPHIILLVLLGSYFLWAIPRALPIQRSAEQFAEHFVTESAQISFTTGPITSLKRLSIRTDDLDGHDVYDFAYKLVSDKKSFTVYIDVIKQPTGWVVYELFIQDHDGRITKLWSYGKPEAAGNSK